ncbi:MAG: hypothetical protein FWE31_04540 [Firmicutes bacterium]|nr:hypothetical protein [Bacillota bacterium]
MELIETVLDEYKCPSLNGRYCLKVAVLRLFNMDVPIILNIKEFLIEVGKCCDASYDNVERGLRTLADRWFPTLCKFGICDKRPTVSQLLVIVYRMVKDEEALNNGWYPGYEDEMKFSAIALAFK